MFGMLYLVLSFIIGYHLIRAFLPCLFSVGKNKSLFDKPVSLSAWMVTLPASFLVGTLVMTWVTYIAAYIFQQAEKPLVYGNTVSMGAAALWLTGIIVLNKEKAKRFVTNIKSINRTGLPDLYRRNRTEIIFILMVTAVWSFLMFRSFYYTDGTMHVGISVFSDFAPHLAVIRSFSLGANFPTEYPHFAGEGIRYHFLFQFLAGNLEFLGLRIDWAFNLPSILSILSFLMLLYSFAVVLTEKKWVGIITVTLFFFRSSFAFFTFMAEMNSVKQAVSTILTNDLHIGKTLHEEWGLWAQKVYVNQRHFAFSLGILVLTLIALYPLFKKMIDSLNRVKDGFQAKFDITTDDRSECSEIDTGEVTVKGFPFIRYIRNWIKEFFFKKDSWATEDTKRSLVIGIILGLISFWNGAVVLAALVILFILALCSKHRLEYLIIAVITVVLSVAESGFFIGPGTAAVEPRLTIGFLARSKHITGILAYYLELLGLLPCIIAAVLFILPKGGRWMTLAFLAPIIMATTLQVTPDITVNHKYVIVSVIFLNIFAAYFLYRLFAARTVTAGILATLLMVILTITGIVDLITLYNLDKNSLEFRSDDPLLNWTLENTGPNEIFLTPQYSNHPILLAGRKIFYGWPYYPWSAGYDTAYRRQVVREIYGGHDITKVRELIKKHNISYIVIDNDNRTSGDYRLNYDLIRENFVQVYIDPARGLEIFRTP